MIELKRNSHLNISIRLITLVILGLSLHSCDKKSKKSTIPRSTPPATTTPSTPPIGHKRTQEWSQTDVQRQTWHQKQIDQTSEIQNDVGSSSAQIISVTNTALGPSSQFPSQYSAPIANGRITSTFPNGNPAISTTGVVDKGEIYIDSQFDSILSGLKKVIDGFKPESYKTDSIRLAMAINALKLRKDPETGQLFLNILFEGPAQNGSPSSLIRAVFTGQLGPNKTAFMQETNETNGDQFPFTATVVCIDTSPQTCENTIIRIDQYANLNTICKTTFVIHRIGKVHVTFDESDYLSSLHSQNLYYQYFMQYLKNTHDAVQKELACLYNGSTQCGTPLMELPGSSDVQLETWAAAYGRSRFVLYVLSAVTNGDPIQDQLILDGPLVAADVFNNPQPHGPLQVQFHGRRRNLDVQDHTRNIVDNRGRLATYLSQALLLKTNGFGDIDIQLNFAPANSTDSAHIGIHSQVLPVKSPEEIVNYFSH